MLSVASTPDGNYILSGSKDRGVRFWDPRNGNALLLLQGHKNSGMVKPTSVAIRVPYTNRSCSYLRRAVADRTLVRDRFRGHAGSDMELPPPVNGLATECNS